MPTIAGRIVTEEKVFDGAVEIEDGTIKRVTLALPTYAKRFPHSCLIFPGFIDVHVHCREDPSGKWSYKEDFKSASAAAINGGVTAIADMPNNPQPPIDAASYAVKVELTKKAAPLDVFLFGGIGPGTKPFGAPFYKVYTCESVGPLFFKGWGELEQTLANYRGAQITFHCEDPEILEAHKSDASHETRRPPEAEVAAVGKVIALAKRFGIKAHIAHMSAAASLPKIRAAHVTSEVTPHHLFFDAKNKEKFARAKLFKMNPPLRSPKDRRALLAAVRDGRIGCLATDHAPHTLAEKESENPPSGFPHLDTYGPFVSWLLQQKVSPETVAKICSANPGRFFGGSRGNFGRIAEGFVGSLTIIDTKKPITINAEMLKTKCAWSPFEGVKFPGSVAATVVRGELF